MPEGLLYREEFLSPQDEATLLGEIRRLPLEAAKYRAFTAKRRIAAYGASYDFDSNRLEPAPPLPEFLRPLRRRVAGLVGMEEESLRFALVTEYRPGTELGWHRDAPQFGLVAGVSLAGRCRMRFRRYPPQKGASALELELAPRSVYVLRDEIRWGWQHSVARTKELRYSVTLRSAR